jgi:hypothetical protein
MRREFARKCMVEIPMQNLVNKKKKYSMEICIER